MTNKLKEKPKQLTREDLKKIMWVQNISASQLHLDVGDDERGIVIEKDEVVELARFFTDEDKLKCRSLYDALIGIDFTGGRGGKKTPLLRIVTGPDDPNIISTRYKGNRFQKIEGTQLNPDKNIYDVKLMEQKLKEMEDNLETLPDDEEKEMKLVLIENYKKKIEDTKIQAAKDSRPIISKASEGAVVAGEGSADAELQNLDDELK